MCLGDISDIIARVCMWVSGTISFEYFQLLTVSFIQKDVLPVDYSTGQICSLGAWIAHVDDAQVMRNSRGQRFDKLGRFVTHITLSCCQSVK